MGRAKLHGFSSVEGRVATRPSYLGVDWNQPEKKRQTFLIKKSPSSGTITLVIWEHCVQADRTAYRSQRG